MKTLSTEELYDLTIETVKNSGLDRPEIAGKINKTLDIINQALAPSQRKRTGREAIRGEILKKFGIPCEKVWVLLDKEC